MSEIKVLAGLESESSLKNGSGAAASETGLGTEASTERPPAQAAWLS